MEEERWVLLGGGGANGDGNDFVVIKLKARKRAEGRYAIGNLLLL